MKSLPVVRLNAKTLLSVLSEGNYYECLIGHLVSAIHTREAIQECSPEASESLQQRMMLVIELRL